MLSNLILKFLCRLLVLQILGHNTLFNPTLRKIEPNRLKRFKFICSRYWAFYYGFLFNIVSGKPILKLLIETSRDRSFLGRFIMVARLKV